MAAKNPQGSAEQLREKIATLQAKLKRKEAAEKTQARKDDTRRCIIAGRYILKHAELNPNDPLTKKLITLLDEYLTPDDKRRLTLVNEDRALFKSFGLQLLPEDQANDDDSESTATTLKSEFRA